VGASEKQRQQNSLHEIGGSTKSRTYEKDQEKGGEVGHQTSWKGGGGVTSRQ